MRDYTRVYIDGAWVKPLDENNSANAQRSFCGSREKRIWRGKWIHGEPTEIPRAAPGESWASAHPFGAIAAPSRRKPSRQKKPRGSLPFRMLNTEERCLQKKQRKPQRRCGSFEPRWLEQS